MFSKKSKGQASRDSEALPGLAAAPTASVQPTVRTDLMDMGSSRH